MVAPKIGYFLALKGLPNYRRVGVLVKKNLIDGKPKHARANSRSGNYEYLRIAVTTPTPLFENLIECENKSPSFFI